MKASISLDEGMAPTLLQLLQAALCGVKPTGQQNFTASSSSSSSASPVKQKKDKNKAKADSKQAKQGESLSEIVTVRLLLMF